MAGILPVGRTGQSVPAGATLMQSCMLNLHVASFERRDYGQGDLARCPETPRRHSRCGKYRTISTSSSSSSRSNVLEESLLKEFNRSREGYSPILLFNATTRVLYGQYLEMPVVPSSGGCAAHGGGFELAPRRRIARRYRSSFLIYKYSTGLDRRG
ncbi:hypothetical protein IQ07DRAFT_282040 [Pyrenochaeta sp. DS3sAY3a]|nr:hypothetical protein IQ07DRAFT_282040 [Pyrenochaeta sp. DS3sAY3a]